MIDSGLYIVTLNNFTPISVNAQDPRLVGKCIEVTRDNCKFGKAKSFAARQGNYTKTFGEQNVNFRPLAAMLDIDIAERLVLAKLNSWRMRGRTGRRNEWLAGITPAEVEKIVFEVLEASELEFLDLRK